MTFGITSSGFRAKRLADIKSEIETSLKLAFGDSINLLPSGVLGQIVGIQSEREEKLWQLAEAVYNSQYPATSQEVTLDNVVSLTGITRQPGVKSKATLHFKGTVGTIIPAGSVFSVLNESLSRFVLESSITLVAGVNAIQKITLGATPDSGDFKIVYRGQTTASIAYNASAGAIKAALEALSLITQVNVTLGVNEINIEFTGAVDGERFHPLISITANNLLDGVTPVTATPSNTITGIPNGSAIVFAEDIGETSAPAYSLVVIENPIVNLNSVENPTDAIIGRDIESDADLKTRRAESLQRAGAGTLGAIVSILADLDGVLAVVGFENITFIEDVDGRPPKSFEIVIDGGDEQEIAQDIWENKPAGIQTTGDIGEPITDSQGFPRTVYFSRPTDVDIYAIVDLVTDVDFPMNGDIIARDALVEFGNSLGIGKDIIVIPQLICALGDIPGVIGMTIKIGTAPAPTLSNNIVIASDEISRWDSTRVQVNVT